MPLARSGLLPWPMKPTQFGATADLHAPASDQSSQGREAIANSLVQIHHFESPFLTYVFNLTQNMAFWFPLPLFHFRI